MLGSLFLDPTTAGPLWARWWSSADQPDRRGFRLSHAEPRDGDTKPVALVWRERDLSPFATLSTVSRADHDPDLAQAAPALIIPPLAGGFAMLLRDVVATLAADRTAHVLEWINPRRIKADAGPFGIDQQALTIRLAAEVIEREAHWLAVCQAGPAALLAAATAERAPMSMTVIGSPIDAETAPSPISTFIKSRPMSFYRSQIVRRASGRFVYPAETHRAALYGVLATQSPEKHELARLIREGAIGQGRDLPFVEMVTSLMDQPAELYLETLERIYLAPSGPCAGLMLGGEPVDPKRLASTPILSVEGASDLVATPGQTAAALTLFPASKGVAREQTIASDTGHFGLFHGPGWRRQVAPKVREFLERSEARRSSRKPSTARPAKS